MTCCIAALASGYIVLVSDKMVGTSIIQGEPEGLLKVGQVHDDWWALFAGDVDLPGDLLARLKAAFPPGPLSVNMADAYLSTTMFEKWNQDTERRFLRPEGYTSETFRDVAPKTMTEAVYKQVRDKRNNYSLEAAVILTGFDGDGTGHILSCYGFDDVDHKQFVPANHDMTGYYAIGTGAASAMWMMSYKDVGPLMSPIDVAYYAVEGKYYAELGQGVGECTDLIVLRHKKRWLGYNTRVVNKSFIPVCEKLRPRKLRKKYRNKLLNARPVKGDKYSA